jgi:hypothetical protein
MELLERLEISDSLPYFVPDINVMAVDRIRTQIDLPNALIASTLVDDAIDVIQNPTS